MKVQEFLISGTKGYLLLDDEYRIIKEVRDFMRHLFSIGKSPNTQRTYCFDLSLYYEYLKLIKISALELCSEKSKGPILILSEFIFWLQYPNFFEGKEEELGKPKRSNRTVNSILSGVLTFYEFLSMNGELDELPVYRMQRTGKNFKSFLYEMVKQKSTVKSSVLKMPVKPSRVKYITRDQYEILFKSCKNRRDKIMLGLLFECGLRSGEALGIHLSPDLDELQDGKLCIISRNNNENGARVKRQAEGIVGIPPYLQSLINDYLIYDICEYESDFLFLNLEGETKGTPMKYGSLNSLFASLSRKTDILVHPHMLRHGFAQEKLESGWSLEQIQAYLRHKNTTSTEIYAQFSEEMKINLANEFFEKRGEKLNGYGSEHTIYDE